MTFKHGYHKNRSIQRKYEISVLVYSWINPQVDLTFEQLNIWLICRSSYDVLLHSSYKEPWNFIVWRVDSFCISRIKRLHNTIYICKQREYFYTSSSIEVEIIPGTLVLVVSTTPLKVLSCLSWHHTTKGETNIHFQNFSLGLLFRITELQY